MRLPTGGVTDEEMVLAIEGPEWKSGAERVGYSYDRKRRRLTF